MKSLRALSSLVLCFLLALAPAAEARQSPGSAEDRRLVAQAIADDATYWAFNRLDSGSVGEVTRSPANDAGNYVVQGNFTYNGGRPGWARVLIGSGRVSCITFHDAPSGGCREVRRPATPPPSGSSEAIALRRQAEACFDFRHFQNFVDNRIRTAELTMMAGCGVTTVTLTATVGHLVDGVCRPYGGFVRGTTRVDRDFSIVNDLITRKEWVPEDADCFVTVDRFEPK